MTKHSFPYLNHSLYFDAKHHKYTIDDIVYTSVTQFLGELKTPFDPYSISKKVSKNSNSEYFGIDPKSIRKLWTETARRGTLKHHSIEKWLVGGKRCVEADYLTNLGITPETSWAEIPVFNHSLRIAGMVDIITKEDDALIVYDIKTSKKIDDTKLEGFTYQCQLYSYLLHYMTGGNIPIIPGGIISIKPEGNISDGVNHNFMDAELIPISNIMSPELKLLIKNRKLAVKNQTI